jgi:hypothetical protein
LALISRRECLLIGLKDKDINWFVDEIRSFLEKEKIPRDCAVNVFKDWAGCCGYLPLGVAIEIEGPNRHAIRDLDLKIYSKIIEICERERIEHHECEPLQVLPLD